MVPSVAMKKIPSDTTGDRSRDPPTSSIVPWPLRYPSPPADVVPRHIAYGVHRALRYSSVEYIQLYATAVGGTHPVLTHPQPASTVLPSYTCNILHQFCPV
jgi:hypothetical protein